jgi:hypothetical protein
VIRRVSVLEAALFYSSKQGGILGVVDGGAESDNRRIARSVGPLGFHFFGGSVA